MYAWFESIYPPLMTQFTLNDTVYPLIQIEREFWHFNFQEVAKKILSPIPNLIQKVTIYTFVMPDKSIKLSLEERYVHMASFLGGDEGMNQLKMLFSGMRFPSVSHSEHILLFHS